MIKFNLLIGFFCALFLVLTPTTALKAADRVNFSLTEEETKILTRTGQLSLGLWINSPPYMFREGEGPVQGIIADIISLVGSRLGHPFKIISFPSFAKAFEASQNGEVDILGAVTKSARHQKLFNLTTPYLQVPVALMTETEAPFISGLADLAGQRVVVGKGHITQQWISRDYPGINLIPTEDYASGLKIVSKGRAVAYAGPLAALAYFARQEHITNLKVAAYTEYSYHLGLAVRKDWPGVAALLNRVLKDIGPQEKNDILNRWLSLKTQSPFEWPKIISWAGVIGLAVLLLIGFFLLWNRRLAKEVAIRARTEKALEVSEARLRQIIDLLPVRIFSKDREGRFGIVNRAMAEDYGRTVEELTGRLQTEVVSDPEEMARIIEIDRQVINSGRPIFDLERLSTYQNGKSIFFRTTKIPFFESGTDQPSILGISVDITEEKRAAQEKAALENQLRQSQKMESLGTLAGGIAHDFNNILAAVMGYAELAREDAKSNLVNPEALDGILDSAIRARDLVTQVLAFSRKVEANLLAVDLNAEILNIKGMLERLIPRMVDIRLDLSRELCRVKADAGQLTQVLVNLVTNAADAMPEGGLLTITTANAVLAGKGDGAVATLPPGNYALIKVSDTGQGMDAETLQNIFDPFFTGKDIGRGTGLGLSMVYGIITGHQGHISCRSEPGRGTEFRIYLPALPDQESLEKSDSNRRIEQLSGGGELLLLVDDDPSLRALGQKVLEKGGYRVLSAQSGEEALEVYTGRGPEIDLVILDIGMPGMGGHRCLEELLKLNPAVKVLVASGYSFKGKLEDLISQGAAGYLAKPFLRADLLFAVQGALAKSCMI